MFTSPTSSIPVPVVAASITTTAVGCSRSLHPAFVPIPSAVSIVKDVPTAALLH